MQTTPSLSNAPPAEQAEAAAAVPPTLQAQQLETQLQALREQARAQEAQLQGLQTQVEQTPLLGWFSDSPLGLALEGLLIGVAALTLGAACGWGLAARRRGADPQPVARDRVRMRRRPGAAEDFADSMLYLADQDPDPGVQQTVELHTPAAPRPAPVSVPPEPAQGATARTPASHRGDAAVADAALLEAVSTRSIFGAPVEPSEFDIHAAAGEVERVRNYLAKRRAARAMGMAPHVGDPYADAPAQRTPGHEETVRMPRPPAAAAAPVPSGVEVDIDLDFCAALQADPGGDGSPVPDPAAEPAEAPAVAGLATPVPPQAPVEVPAPEHSAPAGGEGAAQGTPEAAPPHEEPMLELDLSQGASRLVDLIAAPGAPAASGPDLDLDALAAGLALHAEANGAPPAPVVAALAAVPAPTDEPVPGSAQGRCVQLELAQEFLELGLLQEARERALEVLQQAQTEFHEPARQLLRQLPLDVPPSSY